jgi:uncharacterized protein YqgC (DUF456 family)
MPVNETGTITLKLVAQDLMTGQVGKAIAGMDKMAQKGGIVGSVFQGMGQKLGQMLNPLGLITDGIGMVTDVLSESIKKAMDEQAGIERLGAALKANIPAWKGNTDAIEGVIAAREKLAFSDGEQRDALSLLVARTHDVTKALELEREAMDLARLRGMSLADAATVIGKVYSGNVAILQRYGIAVKKGSTAAEALASIQKQAAGQAETYANTAQGSFESLQIAIDDAEESIGTHLLPTMQKLAVFARDVVVPAINGIADTLAATGPILGVFADLVTGNLAQAEQDMVSAAEHAGQQVVVGLVNGMVVAKPRTTVSDLFNSILDQSKLFGKAYGAGQDIGKSIALGLSRTPEDLAKAMAPVAGIIDATWEDVTRKTKHGIKHGLKLTMHTELQDAKKQGELDAAAVRYAITHPFEGQDLENFYHRKLHAAMKRLKDAEHTGSLSAQAVALADVNKYQALLAQMVAGDKAVIDQLWAEIGKTGVIQGAISKLRDIVHGRSGDVGGSTVHPSGTGEHPAHKNPHPGVGGNARGGVATGWRWVGEEGRELVNFGSPSAVIPHGASEKASGGSVTVHLHYSPQMSTASPREAQQMAEAFLPHMRRAMERNGLAVG